MPVTSSLLVRFLKFWMFSKAVCFLPNFVVSDRCYNEFWKCHSGRSIVTVVLVGCRHHVRFLDAHVGFPHAVRGSDKHCDAPQSRSKRTTRKVTKITPQLADFWMNVGFRKGVYGSDWTLHLREIDRGIFYDDFLCSVKTLNTILCTIPIGVRSVFVNCIPQDVVITNRKFPTLIIMISTFPVIVLVSIWILYLCLYLCHHQDHTHHGKLFRTGLCPGRGGSQSRLSTVSEASAIVCFVYLLFPVC